MNAANIPDSNYIHIERWMYKLGLNMTEIAIFACIHGFCQDGESVFKGSVEYLKAWSGAGRSTVFAALKKMCGMKLLVKRFVTTNGKAYPVYYTVRSRRMYQENAEKNRLLNLETASPKTGLESKNQTGGVQELDFCSPESGHNIIASNDLKIAAEETELESAEMAEKISFLSETIKKTLGCDPYPRKFKIKLNSLAEEKGFDGERVGEYIRFVAEKSRSKNPESLPALFRSLVLAQDVAADFIMKNHAGGSRDGKGIENERAWQCPCCGKENRHGEAYCKKCEFSIADIRNPFKVLQSRQIFNLPKEEKALMDSEIGEVFGRFDIRKFADPNERQRQQTELEAVYKKHGIIIESEYCVSKSD